jgi:hypothetical protein
MKFGDAMSHNLRVIGKVPLHDDGDSDDGIRGNTILRYAGKFTNNAATAAG